METIAGAGSARQRFTGVMLGTFAAIALVLASLGVYGVQAFAVAQRRREIGVRIALGAGSAQIGAAVVRSGLALTGVGVAIGSLGALLLGRSLASLLYEVSASDPIVFTTAPLLILATGLLASCLPALRASSVDPAMSLRDE
jgi:ABC-type antimicrobial peptide transport system permease subunit